jgi:hypothetical protein
MFAAIRRASSLVSSLGERLAVVVALPDDDQSADPRKTLWGRV